MNPYPILAGLILLIAVFFSGLHVGKKLDHDAWMKERSALQTQALNDVQIEVAKRDRQQKFYESNARKASSDHEKALAAVDAKYAAPAKRLRLPASVCANQAAGTNQTTGASGPDEASAATVLIPEPIERDIRSMTKRADDLAEQLRALQTWVIANGLYGDEQPK